MILAQEKPITAGPLLALVVTWVTQVHLNKGFETVTWQRHMFEMTSSVVSTVDVS